MGTSQFKFEFTSDATGTDIGFYIDDVVIVYEQKVRPEEFNVSAQGVSTNGAIAGDWGNISLNIINTGNISETFIPRLDGLPASWNAYYTRPSGTSFDPNGGLISRPGEPASFNIMIQPDVNASLGFPADDRQHHFEAIPQRIHGATRPVFGQGGQNTRDSPSVRPAELSTVVHVHL